MTNTEGQSASMSEIITTDITRKLVKRNDHKVYTLRIGNIEIIQEYDDPNNDIKLGKLVVDRVNGKAVAVLQAILEDLRGE